MSVCFAAGLLQKSKLRLLHVSLVQECDARLTGRAGNNDGKRTTCRDTNFFDTGKDK